MTLTVELRGLPEAVLAADRLTIDLAAPVSAASLIRAVARTSGQLHDALLRADGTPRASAKVLRGGIPVDETTRVGDAEQLTVLAALPCDG